MIAASSDGAGVEVIYAEPIDALEDEPAHNDPNARFGRFLTQDVQDVEPKQPVSDVQAGAETGVVPVSTETIPASRPRSVRERLKAAAAAAALLQTPARDPEDSGFPTEEQEQEQEQDQSAPQMPMPSQDVANTGDRANEVPAVKRRLSLRERIMAASSASSLAGAPDEQDRSFGRPQGGGDVEDASGGEIQEIEGTLNSLRVFNGWAVGSLWTADREEVRVTGESLAGLHEGLEYSFKGKSVTHPVHGEGFAVASAMPVISPNHKAIQKYLVRSFVGIGEVKAEKFIKQTIENGGEAALEVLRLKLLNEPWTLDLTQISAKATFADGEDPQAAIKQLMVTRNLMLRLGAVKGLRENMAKALASHLILGFNEAQAAAVARQKARESAEGEDVEGVMPVNAGDVVTGTWATLMLNPYEPIGKAAGYGFGMAELIASVAQIPRDSPMRLAALVDYAVEQGCQRQGHTFLRQGDFVSAIARVDPTAPVQDALIYAIREGLVVVHNKRVYTKPLYEAEKSVAAQLAELMQPVDPLSPRSFEDVQKKLAKSPEKINPAFVNGFDEHQVKAVAGILLTPQRLHVLSGGPGTGKTAIMETLLSLLKSKSFAFCAPTGMAAKVLTSRVSRYGYTAVTVHSLLKGSEEEGFKVNENEPLDCDVLVVDESTMNGIVMANALLRALPSHAHLIILGDPGLSAIDGVADSGRAGQLPSISPGRFMQDLLLLPNIHHEHLTKTYRNSGGILDVIDETARGKLQTVDRAAVKFSHGLPEAAIGFPAVMQEYLDRVAADGIEKTFLVMPLRKGDRETPGWNATYANHVLRQTCNPQGERLPGSILHLGDRVVIRENMQITQPLRRDLGAVRELPNAVQSAPAPEYVDDANDFDFEDDKEPVKKRVVNGDKGTIVAYAMPSNQTRLGSPRWVRLALDDGQVIEFPGAEMASLQHAYAGTVHGAQGSEFKNVIMVVTPGMPDFMNQNMLLTGLSRAQSSLSVHGEDRVLKKISATPMPMRNSAIVELVKEHLQQIQTKREQDADDEPLRVPVPDLNV